MSKKPNRGKKDAGFNYVNEGRQKKIDKCVDDAIKRNPKAMKNFMEAMSENILGDNAFEDDKYDKAMKHYQKALKLGAEAFGENSYQQVNSLIAICETYIVMNDWKNAEKHAYHVLKIGADFECNDTIQSANRILDIIRNVYTIILK